MIDRNSALSIGAQAKLLGISASPDDRFKPATQMRCDAVLRVACAVHPKLRLSGGFEWPRQDCGSLALSREQFDWLVAGLPWP